MSYEEICVKKTLRGKNHVLSFFDGKVFYLRGIPERSNFFCEERMEKMIFCNERKGGYVGSNKKNSGIFLRRTGNKKKCCKKKSVK